MELFIKMIVFTKYNSVYKKSRIYNISVCYRKIIFTRDKYIPLKMMSMWYRNVGGYLQQRDNGCGLGSNIVPVRAQK